MRTKTLKNIRSSSSSNLVSFFMRVRSIRHPYNTMGLVKLQRLLPGYDARFLAKFIYLATPTHQICTCVTAPYSIYTIVCSSSSSYLGILRTTMGLPRTTCCPLQQQLGHPRRFSTLIIHVVACGGGVVGPASTFLLLCRSIS